MKDFFSFTEENSNKNKTESPKNGKNVNFAQFAQLASKYEGKSAEEMMQAIVSEAERSRKNGTLSNEDIDNFASSVAPLLNDKQRKMLMTVVQRLKKI
ncbi:MAG: hypothetical protein E7360_00755 [Clostridiales bacterium]|nr:hypothetical protein [Clostridiales bacterium]